MRERNRRVNVFVLILRSHDLKFEDVINAIISNLKALNRDMKMSINEENTMICVFIYVFLDDISQQLNNKDLLRQNVEHDYNYYLININKRNKLDFNIINHERYHYALLNARKTISIIKNIDSHNQRVSKKTRIEYMKSIELIEAQFSLIFIALALNIIRSRSSNIAHSKYRDLKKIV